MKARILALILLASIAGLGFAEGTPAAAPSVEDESAQAQPPKFVEKAVKAEEPTVDVSIFLPQVDEAPKTTFEKFKALAGKDSLVPIFLKGGPIMYPLLLASILALGTVIDRLFFMFSVRGARDSEAMEEFFEAVGKDKFDEAIRIAMRSKYYVLRTLGYALQHKEQSLANALLFAQEQEMKRFRRGIPILDTIITLAPLLGLLGTVTGMMGSFALIGGDLSSPGAVTGGIAEALIATSFGLGIAITSLIPFNYLNNKMDNARLDLDAAATQLEMMIQAKGNAVAAKKSEKQAAAGPSKSNARRPPIADRPRRKIEAQELEPETASVYG